MIIVRIEWNTYPDNSPLPPGADPIEEGTYGNVGPFRCTRDAVRWMNRQPDDTDVHDMYTMRVKTIDPQALNDPKKFDNK
jgi:hypothetical protein